MLYSSFGVHPISTTIVAQRNAALQMNNPAYVHGERMSTKELASSSAGIRLISAAMVLLTQCISIVSFSEPVL